MIYNDGIENYEGYNLDIFYVLILCISILVFVLYYFIYLFIKKYKLFKEIVICNLYFF